MEIVPARIIEAKRQGKVLSAPELAAFFNGFLDGEVPDYQMSAFLMAVHFRGLDRDELDVLLGLMIGSGATLEFSELDGPVVDKHSTGGVGDKTSLVLAPIVAALGAYIPMMSGRGLGHTTGTLDKLEAIPGFRTRISLEEFRRILRTVGVAMIGQTEEIAPLDRRLYSLRDATATVPSLPLIAASIMSKKVAEGLDALVLDVKTDVGSFLPDFEDSQLLAQTMVELGEGQGVRTTALITSMDAPLGRAVGNGLETREALACLAGEGPKDLEGLSLALAGEMLYSVGISNSPSEGEEEARGILERGRGLEKMAELVHAQGGDSSLVERWQEISPAPVKGVVEAIEEGFVSEIHPLALGHGVVALGGGRRRMDDEVDPSVGFVLEVAHGERVEVGQPLGQVHAADQAGLETGKKVLAEAVKLMEVEPSPRAPLIRERIAC
jgi:pyrimidine-nucleoside phosphorylase